MGDCCKNEGPSSVLGWVSCNSYSDCNENKFSFKCVKILKYNSEKAILCAIEYSVDNETFLVFGKDRAINIWNTDTDCIKTLIGHYGDISCLTTYSV